MQNAKMQMQNGLADSAKICILHSAFCIFGGATTMRAFVVTVLATLTYVTGVHAQSRSINVGDAVINYEITGSGEPLVLIHGWAQDLTIWDDQVRDFSRNYRVLRYD